MMYGDLTIAAHAMLFHYWTRVHVLLDRTRGKVHVMVSIAAHMRAPSPSCSAADFYGKEEGLCEFAQCSKHAVVADDYTCLNARDKNGDMLTKKQCLHPDIDHMTRSPMLCPCVTPGVVRAGEVVAGGRGMDPTQPRVLAHPNGLVFDRDENLYVADSVMKRVSRCAS